MGDAEQPEGNSYEERYPAVFTLPTDEPKDQNGDAKDEIDKCEGVPRKLHVIPPEEWLEKIVAKCLEEWPVPPHLGHNVKERKRGWHHYRAIHSGKQRL
jgi:hypothetical protein